MLRQAHAVGIRRTGGAGATAAARLRRRPRWGNGGVLTTGTSASCRRSAVSLVSHGPCAYADAHGSRSVAAACRGGLRRPLATLKEGEDEARKAAAVAESEAEMEDTNVSESVGELSGLSSAKPLSGAGIGLLPPPPPPSSSSKSGIVLPPPPPLSSSSSGSRFILPPPPPSNIVGVSGAGGGSAKVTRSSNPSTAGQQAVGATGDAGDGGGSGTKGPKKIVIDDILFGKKPTPVIAGSNIELPSDEQKDDGGGDEDEHVDAHVTFHPLTTAQYRGEGASAIPVEEPCASSDNEEQDQDVEMEDGNDAENSPGILPGISSDLSVNDSTGTTILPRADLSNLLPPSAEDGGDVPTFRSKSLLPSVDFLFDIDGNKKKKLRIGTGIPDAYRIEKDDDNEKGQRSRGKKKVGGASRRAVVGPSVRDQSVRIKTIEDGPRIVYGTGKIAQLAKGCVMASSGETLVMTTVVHESIAPSSEASKDRRVADAMKRQCRKHTGLLPLTVSYSERYAGVGKIPTNQARRDNMRPTATETLASRAIDRALRPLLPREYYGNDDAIEINCSVQSFDASGDTISGDPVAVAINAASAALFRSGLPFTEPVGAVRLCLDCAGTVIFDPSPEQMDDAQLDLLVAATRNDIVMIEFGGNPPRAYREDADDEKAESVIYANRTPGIPEDVVADLLRLAHASIQGIIEEQERDAADETQTDDIQVSVSDAKLFAELGLDASKLPGSAAQEEDSFQRREDEASAKQIIEQAFQFIFSRLGDAAQRLFGSSFADSALASSDYNPGGATIHDGEPLLAKSVRGRREHLVRQEISRLLSKEFVPVENLRALYENIVLGEDRGVLDALSSSIHERLLKEAMSRCAIELGTRGDRRAGPNHQGLLTVRPIEAHAPLLPDVVHGSALFSRGETQVLCTTTLGAPREGLPISDPYAPTSNSLPQSVSTDGKGPYDDLPVGSLRFLKNQQALESDLNSKRVKADRDMTGDSGSLGEARRAFLHYDFPSYSTGETRRPGPAVNRRAIGHGSLAERGVLPILPPPAAFPYTIRMTSEVTSSNGSSSMASVCGATLALLDAGVPILAPAAGVSIGLVRGDACGKDKNEESFAYLLDLTGTEDHYGEMDFKVAGTDSGLTAMQLDVKRPVPLEIVIQAMDIAKEGRTAILSSMSAGANESSAGIIHQLEPRRRLKSSAPRVEIVRFNPARKRDLVGPGGAVLKQLESRYGVSLDLSQEGQCLLYGNDAPAVAKAKSAVQDLVADVVEGEIYQGTIIEIKDFGAVIELLRNKEGLLHVSELGSQVDQHPEGNFGLVRKELTVGDQISVRCIGVDPVQGHIKLSRKSLLQEDIAV